MPKRVVTLVGAGSRRCGPPVLASLATWYPDTPLEVRLFDANEERLDLMDRFARSLFDDLNSEVKVTSGSDIAEALEETTDLLLALHEDCARRMTGTRATPSLANFVDDDPWELRRGDRNRPTPAEQLSPYTLQILEVPAESQKTREEAILAAVLTVLQEKPPTARCASLMRGIVLPPHLPHTHLNWPDRIEEDKLALIPHQVLRWIRGDEKPHDLVEAGRNTPVRDWLDQPQASY